jgi:hypothetical protein
MIRAEAPRILLTGPPAVTAEDKGPWRRKFLENLAVISKKAKEKLASAQKRYKSKYDAHVRERNAKLITGYWVLVKVFADSPKLTLPLAGPYELSEVDARNGTYIIKTAEGLCPVPSYRVKPAPFPRDLTSRIPPGAKPERPQEDDATVYVIGSTYRLPCIDMPDIDMPRLSSTCRFHISICHVFHCHVTHIAIRDGTVTPRILLPCHPHHNM